MKPSEALRAYQVKIALVRVRAMLVDPERATSLLTIAGLKIDAEKLLGVPVSVLTPDGLPPKFRNEVLQQATAEFSSGRKV